VRQSPARGGDEARSRSNAKAVAEIVREHPDATLSVLRILLGVDSAVSSVRATLIGMNLCFERSVHAAEQDPPDVAQAQATWKNG
jgi:hypothetical protein